LHAQQMGIYGSIGNSPGSAMNQHYRIDRQIGTFRPPRWFGANRKE
jgi:hypothetical protein